MPNKEAPLHKAAGVDAHMIGDEWLLFSAAAQTLFRLNTSAGFIWSCLEEDLDTARIRARFAAAFGLDSAHADHDVAAIVNEWRALGLLESDNPVQRKAGVGKAAPVPVSSAVPVDEEAFVFERFYRLLDTVIRIRGVDPAMQAVVDAILMPGAAVPQQPFEVAIDVWRDGRTYTVLENGKPVAQCDKPETLPPVLLAQLAGAAYFTTESLMGVHAAAVSRGRDCLIFPALSGSGKSTLTAALVASGYQYGSDEMVLLKPGSQQVLTAPLGLSLKPGSWPVLSDYYPYLDALPVYLRPDGKQVRYLLPPHGSPSLTGREENTVRALVFPVYRPGGPIGLTEITPADALCRLTEAGYDVGGGLNRESVAELVGWVRKQPCYALQFDDLKQAVTKIGELLP